MNRNNAPFELYMWEPSISPHKLGLLRALKSSPAVKSILYIADADISPERRQLGWEVDELLESEIVIAPSESKVAEIVAASGPDSIHIFSGIHWVPSIVRGIRLAIAKGRRFGLMTEPRSFEGAKGRMRLLHSWLTEGRVRRHADFVLAIGAHGPAWFARAGFRQEKIFPFAYFLEPPPTLGQHRTGQKVRLAHVGRLNQLKGTRLFLDAINLINLDFAVEIAGVGADVNFVLKRSHKDDRINYLGALPIAIARQALERADIVVAASLTDDDGWNAVVSESLLAGTIVITSERVGASVCFNEEYRGIVLKEPTARSIADAVAKIVSKGYLAETFRSRRRQWALARLTAESGASQLLGIMKYMYRNGSRPTAFYN